MNSEKKLFFQIDPSILLIKLRIVMFICFCIIIAGLVFSGCKGDKEKELNQTYKGLLKTILEEDYQFSTTEELKLFQNNNPKLQFLDIRSTDEYQNGHLEGALNIPFEQILSHESILYFEKTTSEIILYGKEDEVNNAWVILTQMGYSNISIIKEWIVEYILLLERSNLNKNDYISSHIEFTEKVASNKDSTILFLNNLVGRPDDNGNADSPTIPELCEFTTFECRTGGHICGCIHCPANHLVFVFPIY